MTHCTLYPFFISNRDFMYHDRFGVQLVNLIHSGNRISILSSQIGIMAFRAEPKGYSLSLTSLDFSGFSTSLVF